MEKYIYNLFWMTFLGASIFGIVYFVNMQGNQTDYYTMSSEEQGIRNNMTNSVANNNNLSLNPDGTQVPDATTGATDTNGQINTSSSTSNNTDPMVTTTPLPTVFKIDEKAKIALKEKLQGLIADAITMKATSKGTRVTVIKEFLSAYLDQAVKIDLKQATNYSPELIERLKRFETERGLSKKDGLANEVDYTEMIKLLNQ